jgi:hypothetical protein
MKKSIIDGLITGSAIAIAIFILFSLVGLATADVFVYGSNYNYSVNVLPNNSYVHQGENISQGLYYDLSGVYGWTGMLAHWNSSYDIGMVTPDNIVNLNDAKPQHFYIDPAKMPVGKWFQMDEYVAKGTSHDSFGNGNNYVFYVVKNHQDEIRDSIIANWTENKSVIVNSTMYIYNGNESIEVPITIAVNQSVHPNITFVQQPENVHTIVIPTQNVTEMPSVEEPVIVTPNADVPVWIGFVSVAIIAWRKHVSGRG